MAYVTVSTWSYDDALDSAALEASARENMSQLKAMGASGGHLIKTSSNTGMIVMIYPDEGAWNRVRDMVAHMRAGTKPETGGTLTAALDGPALVSV